MYRDELKNVIVTAKLGFKIALQMPVALVEVQSIYRTVFGQLAQHCPNGDLHELSKWLNAQLRVDEKMEGKFDDHELIQALDTQQAFDDPMLPMNTAEAYALAGLWHFFRIFTGARTKVELLSELMRAQALAFDAVRNEGFERIAGRYVDELEQLAGAYSALTTEHGELAAEKSVLKAELLTLLTRFKEAGRAGNTIKHRGNVEAKRAMREAWDALNFDVPDHDSAPEFVTWFIKASKNAELIKGMDGDCQRILVDEIGRVEKYRVSQGYADRRSLMKNNARKQRDL